MTPTDPNERARELLHEESESYRNGNNLVFVGDALRAIARALSHAAAVEGCHCATCTCKPGMTKAIRYDLSPAEQEGAVRDALIALGWTPPAPAAVAGGEVRVTDGMVDAYLAAQAKAVQAVDDKWGAGGKAAAYLHPVREACRAGLEAALAAQPAAGETWHVVEAWVHGGKTAELKLERLHSGPADAVHDMAGQYVTLATPAAQRPGAGDVDGTHTATPCHWIEDTDSGAWDTACGHKHLFTAGDATDNGHSFCPYCGGRLFSQPASGE